MRYRLLAFAITALFAIDLAAATGTERSQEALALINGYRAQHGLEPLRMEARLSMLARDQAKVMLTRRYVDPRSPEGVTLEKRLRRAGYAYRQAFQQIATGYPNGKSVVDSWLQRRDSRQVLLNRSLSEAGIGYAHREGVALDHFWVITLAEPTRPAARNWRREIMRYVNQYRARHKLSPLTLNLALNRTAQAHSDDMAARDFFDHVTPSGKTVGDRATRAGYQWRAVLENLAAGQDNPQEVVTGWINSPPHREALLEPDIDDAGVGYTFLAQDGGVVRKFHYWTLNMGRRR
ncbi:MAG: hypothetical protein GKS00_24275 [Alphaproteobacteria bacterium]|nr:hypothetical protein [Alphaproteobacteria bacterium]